MANPKKQVPENVPGDFFVDSTCIDCDACRQIAPAVFGEAAATSFVKVQPVSSTDRRHALHALLACPTGSIGCLGVNDVKSVMKDFPLVIEEPVFYCGYNSPKSYGGNSYFIRHAAGNWLIDSPKFVTPLVKQLDALGGIAHIFLTHRDDVADAHRFTEHFKSRRIIHRDELSSQPGAEVVLEGVSGRSQPDHRVDPGCWLWHRRERPLLRQQGPQGHRRRFPRRADQPSETEGSRAGLDGDIYGHGRLDAKGLAGGVRLGY
jgi:ferredoxin